MRPEAATAYMSYVAAEFEQYAGENLPRKLGDPGADDEEVLAGLRYVQTRRLTGWDNALRERFTSERRGKLAREIDRACLDALVDCTTNAVSTARFLVEVGVRRQPLPTSGLCADGLQRLAGPAFEVLLAEIGRSEDGVRRRRLALLLGRVSRTKLPESLRFWRDAEPEEVEEALSRWRAVLVEKGRIAGVESEK